MPSRILPGCKSPGCPARSIETARGYCEEHRAAVDDHRGSSTARGYGYAWQKLRAWQLARYPLCEDCGEQGRTTAAEHVDHRTPKARGGTDDPGNLQSLCAACHSRKTATEDGGFGHIPRKAHR